MKPKKKSSEFTDSSRIETFRLPYALGEAARQKARQEDLSFSQLVRRALKREIAAAAK